MKNLITIVITAIILFGCASSPDSIRTVHVSPELYYGYDCDQIAMKMRSVGRKVNELYYELEQEADSDSGQMALGLILFWPALFFLEGGDDYRAGQYGYLKGEQIALEEAAIMKKCNPASMPRFEEPKPKETPQKEDSPTL